MAQANVAAEAAGAGPGSGDIRLVSQRERAWRTFKGNRTAVFGLVLIVLIVGVALAAPLLVPHDPYDQSTRNRLADPGNGYPLGRDDYVRTARAKGLVERTVLVRHALRAGLIPIVSLIGIFAIGLTIAPRFARLAYGPTLSVKAKDFVDAARSIGVGNARIVRVHILPNVAGELLVLASLWTASAIRLEASLSFIGLGVRPPTPTWGQMIRDGTTYLTNAPWIAITPGIALLLTVLAFNLVGDGLRDVLDPRSRA